MIRKRLVSAFISTFFLGAVLLGAAGCGKSLPQLTPDQKAQVSDTVQSAGRSATAARNVGGSRGGHVSAMTRMQGFPFSASSFAGLFSNRVASMDSHDQNELSMESRLQGAHDSRVCDFNVNVPEMSSSSTSIDLSNINVTIKVSGAGCPISMDFVINSQGSQSGINGKITGNYKVNDAEFGKLNDVNSFSMDGAFGVSGSQTSPEMTLDLKGTLSSQKYGAVTYTATADITGAQNNQGSGEAVMDIVFPSFEAKLKVKMDDGKASYSINGEDVSQEEFMKYFSKNGVTMPASVGGGMGAPR